jgi:secondary thiamine-phosphate synthase enzyme
MPDTIHIKTRDKSVFVDITDQLHSFITETRAVNGMLVAFVPHTTAGITINENADPNVIGDITRDLDRLIPERQAYYRHFEGNSAAHLRASLLGSSVTVLISEGRMQLGTWQGIYFAEFDGPRSRRVYVKFLPTPAS